MLSDYRPVGLLDCRTNGWSKYSYAPQTGGSMHTNPQHKYDITSQYYTLQIRQLLYKTGSLCRQITNIRKLVHIYQFRKNRKWVHKSTVHTLKYLKTFVHIIRNTKLENKIVKEVYIYANQIVDKNSFSEIQCFSHFQFYSKKCPPFSFFILPYTKMYI
jgi:hypothetical protein